MSDTGRSVAVRLTTPSACAVQSTKQKGLSAGSVILIIVACLVVVYVGGGMVYNWKFQQKTGIEMVPNIEFWKDLPSLVKDGFLYAIHGFKKDNSYTSMWRAGGDLLWKSQSSISLLQAAFLFRTRQDVIWL